MSGGSYDYIGNKLHDAACELRARHSNKPHVMALASLVQRIGEVMHDVEWADSGDTLWCEKLDDTIRSVLPPEAELAEALRAADRAKETLTAAIIRAQPMHRRGLV